MLRHLDLTAFRGFPVYPLGLACVLGGCGGGDLSLPDDGRAVAAIEVVDGDGQRGSVGEPLESPIVVQVADANGDPVEGATVEFALTSAGEGAGVTPSNARTNADGRAQAFVLLGDKVGVQTGEARVAGEGGSEPKATFSALAASPDNRAPIADFGWSCEDLTCRFSEASTDSDGSVTAWAWRFGDGSTSSEREPTHSYAAAGTYTVRLTVTDDGGARGELSDEVRVTDPAMPPSNQAPRADFDVACRELTCDFTDRSEDEDGRVESRHWDFGDGSTSSGRNPSHRYQAGGQYQVVLTVVDDDGAEDSRTGTAEPAEPAPPPSPPAPPPPAPPPPAPPPPAPEPNDPPQAEFEVTCQDLTCSFADRSEDGDGSLVGWEWNFGDGATSTERNPSHTYGAAGRYDVALTVTDDDGAEDTRRRTAEAEAPAPPPPAPNVPPEAEFDLACDELSCTFTDQSQDSDGTIQSWRWNFGDGATSTDRNPSHTYASPGRYDVVLTVTDDDGAEDSGTRTAKPQAPPPPPNEPPQAEFEVTCQELSCTFVDRSSDGDGSVVSWEWDFGDGATSTDQNPSHTYAGSGPFEVLLRVTDDDGAADTQTQTANPQAPPPPEPNQPPNADFDVDCVQLTCTFTDRSQDDGAIAGWQWSFGDGTTSSEQHPVHAYVQPGRYQVLLTVTDDEGATSTRDREADAEDGTGG